MSKGSEPLKSSGCRAVPEATRRLRDILHPEEAFADEEHEGEALQSEQALVVVIQEA